MLSSYLDLTTLLIGGVILLIGWLTVVKPRGIPPGPYFRFPILGHAYLLQGDMLNNMKYLRKKYGDIFHLYLGSNLVVFLSGYKLIKEALVTKGDIFSDRHKIEDMDEFGMGKGIITASGETWKEHRKFALGALREFGFGRNILQEKISEEVSKFLRCIEDMKGESCDIHYTLHNAVSNVICNIIFGKRFEYDDEKFRLFLKLIHEGIRDSQLLVLVGGKIARHLPGDFVGFHKALKRMRYIKKELLQASLDEHMKTFDPDNIRDFIDAYIKVMKEKEDTNTALTEDQLGRVVMDLFVAGSDTTGTTIRWALVFLLNHPDLQECIFQEIQDKVGMERTVKLEDRSELPLLNAFIMEVQRQGDIAPLAVPHVVSEDVDFHGYHIPKGTMVMPVLDSVLSDPEVWGDPEVFRPERFLQDGQVVKPEEFIPFSLGRRVCLGESLAKMELFLFLSTMIQRFRFEVPENQPPPDIKGVVGFTYSPKDFQLRAIPRQ